MNGTHDLRTRLASALANDARVHLLGEALELSPATHGLLAAHPDRVWLLPAADMALTGVATGMALGGKRPVVELSGPAALWACVGQLGQEAAALLSGEFAGGLVLRVPMTPDDADPTPWLSQIPGLCVAAVGQAGEGALLLDAALNARKVVVILEPRDVLAGPAQPELAPLPLGKARLLREGTHATVLAWGRGVTAAMAAADTLAADGIDVDVIDVRTVGPTDTALIAERVARTGRPVLAGAATPALQAAVDGAFLRLESPPASAPADSVAIATAVRASITY